MIKDFYIINDTTSDTVTVGWDTHNRISLVSTEKTIRLPKITADARGKEVHLVLFASSVSGPVPALELAAGDTWAIAPGESLQQWGALPWLTLYCDIERKQWIAQLSELHNQSAST